MILVDYASALGASGVCFEASALGASAFGAAVFEAAAGAAPSSVFGLRGGKFRAMMAFCGQTSSHLRQDLHLFGSM